MKKIKPNPIWCLFVVLLLACSSCTKTEIIHAKTDFTFSAESFKAPCTISITNNSTYATGYLWDFGDGTTSTEINPVKTYTTEGSYTIKLTATDQTGSATVAKALTVVPNNDPPKAAFSFSQDRDIAPVVATFTNTSYNASEYLWDFGDSTFSTAASPAHTFSKSGNYKVKLKATNRISSDSLVKTILVNAPPHSVSITKITVSAINMKTQANVDWDIGSGGPDVYFELRDATHQLTKTSTMNDVSATSVPFSWTLNVNIAAADYGKPLTMNVYDEDGTFDPDDLMASGILDLNALSATAPATVTKTDSGLTFTINLEWK